MSEFSPENDEWLLYQERLENFFEVTKVKDENDKKVCLLSYIGAKAYKLVRDISTPVAPSAKTYNELCEMLKSFYTQPIIPMVERKIFLDAKKLDTETVIEYSVRLKRLSSNCEFGSELNSYVLNKFITGLSGKMFQRLAEEDTKNLTLEKAINTALKYENQISNQRKEDHQVCYVKQNVNKQYCSAANKNKNVRQEKGLHGMTVGETKQTKENVKRCAHCGYKNHESKYCKFIRATCHKCGEIGHLASVCKFKKKVNFIANSNLNVENNDNILSSIFSDTICEINSNVMEDNFSDYLIELTINDKNLNFFLDNGSRYTLISHKIYRDYFKDFKLLNCNQKINLSSYSGHGIKILGFFNTVVRWGEKSFPSDIHVVYSNNNLPIAGRMFMKQFGIIQSKVELINEQISLSGLLEKYAILFDGKVGKFKYHQIHLEIEKNVIPKFFKPRQVAYAYKYSVEQELIRLEKQGVITPVETSEWGTPLVPIPKPNGGIRLCADYKVSINKYLVDNKHPLPRVEEVFQALQGGVKFSKLDLESAYNQFELDEESRKLVTWSTHKGVFLVNRLPFGIKPATGIFQGEMEKILLGIPGVVNLLDDIVVTGKNDEDHIRNLEEVLRRLADAGLKLKKEKCSFFQDNINYLGHVVSKDGLTKSKERIEAVVKAPVPVNITETRAFCGLVNYYAKFMRNLSCKMSPIYRLLQKNVPFIWDKECESAFAYIKDEIVKSVVLAHFNPENPISLTTDASSYGISGVLSQTLPSGEEKPVAFCSRTLSKAEQNYSVVEKEGLAVIFSVLKFFNYLIGYDFIIKTDHKPLLGLFGENRGYPQMAASRIQRWAVILSAFKYKLIYVKGINNEADLFSRLPLPVKEAEDLEQNYMHFIKNAGVKIDYKLIEKETREDKILSELCNAIRNGKMSGLKGNDWIPFSRRKDELYIQDGIVMWGYRVVIPKSLQKGILQYIHASHLGMVKCKSIARSYFWWPNMNVDLENEIRNCVSCLSVRPDPAKSELIPWENTKKIWSRIHLDYAGPVKNYYYLIITDSFSKWVEVFATKTITSEFTIGKLREVFGRFGLPDTIVTDCGTQFRSKEFQLFCESNGIHYIATPPGHPSSNGAAENAVKSFKKSFCAAINHIKFKNTVYDSESLNLIINRYLCDYRLSTHCSTGESPVKIMLGRTIKTRFDLIRPPNFKDYADNPDLNSVVAENIDKSLHNQVKNSKGKRREEFMVNDSVMIRDYNTNINKKGWIKAKILRVLGKQIYLCQMESGRKIVRHINQIIRGKVNESDGELDNYKVMPGYSEIKLKRSVVTNNKENVINDNLESNSDSLEISNDTFSNLEELFVQSRPKRNIKPPVRLNL